MAKFMDEPYYSLFSKAGREDIKHAYKKGWLDRHLLLEIADHTWFSVTFKINKWYNRWYTKHKWMSYKNRR